MKSNMKKIASVLVIILLLCMTTVHAANDYFKTTLKTDHAQAKAEDTVIITIGLKDIAIESGDKGIGAYTAKIGFDSSVFEYVSANGADGWSSPLYQNGLITCETNTGKVVNTSQDIARIVLKVKKGAKVGETEIKLTNFSGSNGKNEIESQDTAIKITIVADNSGNNGGNNNNSNSLKNTSIGTTDKSLKQGKLPKAGNTNIIIFTVIGLVVILAIIFLVKIAVVNKKMK